MFLNFYPIIFDFDSFQVQRLPYDKNLLDRLRLDYHVTHSFFRNGDYIYLCPFEDKTDLVGDIVTLNVSKDLNIIGSLIRHLLFRTFTSSFPDIKPRSFYPFRFKSRNPKHDLAADLLPNYLR